MSLFQRTGRSVLLTEHGRTLYKFARQIVDLADEACNAISNAPRVVRGTLRIAASTVPSEWLLPEVAGGVSPTVSGGARISLLFLTVLQRSRPLSRGMWNWVSLENFRAPRNSV